MKSEMRGRRHGIAAGQSYFGRAASRRAIDPLRSLCPGWGMERLAASLPRWICGLALFGGGLLLPFHAGLWLRHSSQLSQGLISMKSSRSGMERRYWSRKAFIPPPPRLAPTCTSSTTWPAIFSTKRATRPPVDDTDFAWMKQDWDGKRLVLPVE